MTNFKKGDLVYWYSNKDYFGIVTADPSPTSGFASVLWLTGEGRTSTPGKRLPSMLTLVARAEQ